MRKWEPRKDSLRPSRILFPSILYVLHILCESPRFTRIPCTFLQISQQMRTNSRFIYERKRSVALVHSSERQFVRAPRWTWSSTKNEEDSETRRHAIYDKAGGACLLRSARAYLCKGGKSVEKIPWRVSWWVSWPKTEAIGLEKVSCKG